MGIIISWLMLTFVATCCVKLFNNFGPPEHPPNIPQLLIHTETDLKIIMGGKFCYSVKKVSKQKQLGCPTVTEFTLSDVDSCIIYATGV